ncbi:hypothetical protein WJX75_001240 [Coccomyxa subellipsoidea]|uniref:Uncharacterized protein n=1 Tax=Coccomyxa subellipsoidea TaxID=248742 RepID=A0ABR2YP65_9CHLO
MMASGGEQGGSFNPFRNKKKEDAAKKALQEMFQGKQDMLAAYDAGGGGSGKGGKGGKGGGDGEGSGGFNWREWSAKFLRDLGGGAKSAAQTVAALLLLLSIFYAATFVRPLSAAALNAVRYILRLDGRGARRGRASVPATAGVGSEGSGVLGSNERSIISKYGADNDAEDAGEDDEGEDGEDAAP